MAKSTLIYPIETIKGKVNHRDKFVFRQKRYRDEKGKVIHEGSQESYIVKFPRDWDANPATEAELRKINLWKQACARTKVIIRKPEDITNDTTLSDEAKAQALATLELWKKRFNAQRTKGESDSPINPKTGKRLCYQRFDCFVRAVILRELQKGE